MTRFALLIFCWLFMLAARGQVKQPCPEYPSLIKAGNGLLAHKNYQPALNKFNAAKLCLPDSSRSVDKHIRDVFNAIEQEKNEAIRQKKLAETARRKAEIAQHQMQLAERQRQIALKAAQKSSREAQQSDERTQALYWASESDRLLPTQAIRLLEQTSQFMGAPPVYERVLKRFNEGVRQRFAQTIIQESYQVGIAMFSDDGQRVLTQTAIERGRYTVWNLQGKNIGTQPEKATTAPGTPSAMLTFQEPGPQNNPANQLTNFGKPVFSALPHHLRMTIGRDSTVRVSDSNNNVVAELRHDALVWQARFSPDSNRVLTVCNDNTVRLWYLPFRPIILLQHAQTVLSAQLSDSQLTTVANDSIGRVWNLDGHLLDSSHVVGPLPTAYVTKGGSATYMVLLDKQNKAYTDSLYWGKGWQKKLWHRQWPNILPPDDPIGSIQYSPDGNWAIASSDSIGYWRYNQLNNYPNKLTLVRVGTTQIFARLRLKGPVQSVSVSPDNSRILTLSMGGNTQTLRIWNRQGKLLDSLVLDGSLRSAEFTVDGSRFYTQSYDMRLPFVTANPYIPTTNTLMLYSLKTKQLIGTLKPNKAVLSVDATPDNYRIVTAGEDKTARIWNWSGDLLTTLPHDDVVNQVRFSPDGNRLITIAGNKAILWYTGEGALDWIKANTDKIAPLSEQIRAKYGIPPE